MRQKTRSLIPLTLLTLLCLGLAACTSNGAAPQESAGGQAPACLMQPDAGMCRAAFTRYYFDEASGSCRSFIWGGCGGSVPFETMQDCQQACNAPASDAAPVAPFQQSLSF